MRLAISISPVRGQQFDATHFTHIHANRIGSAAEIRVNSCQCSRCSRFTSSSLTTIVTLSVSNNHFSIGRFIVHRNAHVVKRADNAFESFPGQRHSSGK
jgi:NMD protein affecting ribosome stability and mRNA decay